MADADSNRWMAIEALAGRRRGRCGGRVMCPRISFPVARVSASCRPTMHRDTDPVAPFHRPSGTLSDRQLSRGSMADVHCTRHACSHERELLRAWLLSHADIHCERVDGLLDRLDAEEVDCIDDLELLDLECCQIK